MFKELERIGKKQTMELEWPRGQILMGAKGPGTFVTRYVSLPLQGEMEGVIKLQQNE